MAPAVTKTRKVDHYELIRQINAVLDARWSDSQMAHGKWIAIDWAWMPVLKKTLNMYRNKGWLITNNVEVDEAGKTLWLVFTAHPRQEDNVA
jgi:hypothetical protein